MVPWLLPVHLLWTVLQPVCERHVTMSEVDRVLPSLLGRHRILLGQNQPHDLSQSYILKEELNMDRIGSVSGDMVIFILEEVVFSNHLDVRIISIDVYWTSQCYGHRSISRKQCPPNTLPQTFIRPTQLRAFDTAKS